MEYSINFYLTTICIVGIITLTIWLIRNYAIGRVDGWSMHPTFTNGEFFIVKKRDFILIEDGVYLFERNGYCVIKRAIDIRWGIGDRPKIFFMGDNADSSIDSRSYGYVDAKNVKGQVIKIKLWRNVK